MLVSYFCRFTRTRHVKIWRSRRLSYDTHNIYLYIHVVCDSHDRPTRRFTSSFTILFLSTVIQFKVQLLRVVPAVGLSSAGDARRLRR